MRWIDEHRPQGSGNNRVTVVFDGKPEHFPPQADQPLADGGNGGSGGVAVIFSTHDSADERIKALVENSKTKNTIVVVSDDKGITLYVRSLGAKVMAVKQFAAGLFVLTQHTSSKRGRTKDGSVGKYISLAKAEQINKEMEKIWFNK